MKNKEEVKFLSAERLASFFEGRLGGLVTLFFSGGAVIFFLQKLGRSFATGLEKLLGREIYVKKSNPLFDKIPPRFHALIKKLHQAGIITNIFYPKPIPGWPRIPAVAVNISGLNSANSGYALDYDTAVTKAVAESLERHSFAFYEERDFIIGTWKDLINRGAVNPNWFAGFSENQLALKNYERHKIKNDSEFAWTKCVSFVDGSKHLIPAQLVYLGYKFLPNEPQIRQTTTNGGAAGASFEMAVYNAICEAVERDSFIIYWLNKITPVKFDVFNSAHEDIRKLAELYKKYEIDFVVLDITTDLEVPAVMTAIREKTPGMSSVYVSTRADLDIEEAVFSSMLDGLRAGFCGMVSEEQIEKINPPTFSRGIGPHEKDLKPSFIPAAGPRGIREGGGIKQKAPAIETIEERHIYWCDKSLFKEGDFLFAGEIRKIKKNEFAAVSLKLKLEKLKDIFKNKNLEVYLADATSKRAKDAGLWVIMSLIPELCPLYLNEHFKYLGVKRLYEAPVKMGNFERPKKEEEMNLIPHPML